MIQSAIAKPRRASDETVKWNGGSVTAVAGRRGSICTPIRDSLRAIGRPGAGGASIEFGSRFDQRRAGAQPGVATVQIRPASPTSRLVAGCFEPTVWKAGFCGPLTRISG
jgi:hypothetical protein